MTTATEADFFQFDVEAQRDYLEEGRKRQDKKYFKRVFVTPRALLTMMKHSIKGANEKPLPKEIVGFLYGRAKEDSIYISDAFATSVIGSETQVIVTDEAQWDVIEFRRLSPMFGHNDLPVGWYHSHPGLYCFFSRTDVISHRIQQSAYGTFVGLVIDPCNTTSSGKVHLGAYITFPTDDFETPIPDDVFVKYGSDANNYYELDIKYFTTNSDRKILGEIIQKSYGLSIGCSPLRINAEYLGKGVQEVSATVNKFGTPKERNGDVDSVIKRINTINNDRKTGIWIHKMKTAVFG
ncbi:Mov34/MPN/PAD-1 family protein [Histomonas meleagridis]|uniref:Mov34/MPN/PAD-1 family protein n=1 Tax=Histomonas meleagridis TaxID=135588 RepID=UPI0035594D15|nr:Mov34/MPN/PAD-1 family protein [Histomonas meleagridis]KAH0800449.1 Mov34/MPN/PAD-1 family protein [Histomonas meleagridis]